jgi:hypothetical protein
LSHSGEVESEQLLLKASARCRCRVGDRLLMG